MFHAFESRLASGLARYVAESAADATTAAQSTSIVFVIAATILVALALRTASRAVTSIVVQIARSIVPAGIAALMLLAAFAMVVFVALTQIT